MKCLATSYYSDDPEQHGRVTGLTGSHARIRANIQRAVEQGIPLRAGIIDTFDGQRVEEARAELTAMGVTQIHVDRQRGVGRGATVIPSVSELCGLCGTGRAAIGPNGEVWACVMARFLPPAGNVKMQPLADILAGKAMNELVGRIPKRNQATGCNPNSDGSDCAPAETEACNPAYGAAPRPANDANDVTMCNPNSDGDQCAPAEQQPCVPDLAHTPALEVLPGGLDTAR